MHYKKFQKQRKRNSLYHICLQRKLDCLHDCQLKPKLFTFAVVLIGCLRLGVVVGCSMRSFRVAERDAEQ
jgi:hypothetical protein